MTNRPNKKVVKTRTLPDLLRDIAGHYEAWKSSLSTPPTPPADDDAREAQEFLEEVFGPDPHPLVTSLQKTVGDLVLTAHQRLLARPGEAAAKLMECYEEGLRCLRNGPDASNNPTTIAILIDLFVVGPMVSLCHDLADEFEARQQSEQANEPLASPEEDGYVVFSEEYHKMAYRDQPPMDLNDRQATIMKILAEGKPVDERTLGAAIDTYAKKYRLLDSFRVHGIRHPAWKYIKKVSKGVYRLSVPVRSGPSTS